MIKIELQDFIIEAIKKKYVLDLRFILGLFTFITSKNYEDDYYKIDNGSFYIKLNDEYKLITDSYANPIATYRDEITIDNTLFNITTKTLKTTLGRLILNTIYIKYALNNKLPYINTQFTIGTIEDMLEEVGVVDDELYKGDDKITVSEYMTFNDMTLYEDTFANFLSLGVTEHSIKPAPGMKELIKKTMSELEKKYNEQPLESPKAIAELEAAIIKYDTEYLKQDPSYGKIITKKVINMSRKRMYGIYGIGGDVQGRNNPILIALIDGLGKDPKTISMLFNDLISGVAGRGDETKDAGVTTKEASRATATTILDDKFCGSKIPIEVVVTKDHIGRYITNSGKPLELTKDTIEKYIGKKVLMYDIITCVSKTGGCLICSGSKYKNYEKTIPLLTTDLGGMLLKNKLKKFHQTELKLVQLTLEDFK